MPLNLTTGSSAPTAPPVPGAPGVRPRRPRGMIGGEDLNPTARPTAGMASQEAAQRAAFVPSAPTAQPPAPNQNARVAGVQPPAAPPAVPSGQPLPTRAQPLPTRAQPLPTRAQPLPTRAQPLSPAVPSGQRPTTDRYGVPLGISAYEREDMGDRSEAAQYDAGGNVSRAAKNQYGEFITHTYGRYNPTTGRTEQVDRGRPFDPERDGQPTNPYGARREIAGQQSTQYLGQSEDGAQLVQDTSGAPRKMLPYERVGRDAYGRHAVVTDARLFAQSQNQEIGNQMREVGMSQDELNDNAGYNPNDLSTGTNLDTAARFRRALARRDQVRGRF